MRIILWINLLLCFIFVGNITAQDTLRNRIDTVICSSYSPEIYFSTSIDTAAYNSAWYSISDSTPFSFSDSVLVSDQDSLILISSPVNVEDTVLVDTILISLRFLPNINLIAPIPICYTGDSLVLKDSSAIYGDYTQASYTTADGLELSSIDSLIKVLVGNGDSLDIIATYLTAECSSTIDSTVALSTKFKPISSFTFTEECFGDSTFIFNNSQFVDSLSTFSLSVDGLSSFGSGQDSFAVLLPFNAESRDVFIEIVQNGCNTMDTFVINNKLQPSAEFDPVKTCENEFLQISNLSSESTGNATYTILINEVQYPFNQMNSFNLPDTLADGLYDLLGIIDNGNGCLDSSSIVLEIDSVTYVSFVNLEDTYCERQDSSLLLSNVTSGLFEGAFITDFGNGTASFAPSMPTTNVTVSFTYTNSNQCTDQQTQTVTEVYPKPILELSGLLAEYCEADPATELILNQSISANSIFEITRDNVFFDSELSLSYTFNPELPGNYSFLNVYTDANGCFDSLINTTVVNPLPNVELDSLTVISPGESILIGNTSGSEADVDYIWTDGSDMSTLLVNLPGIYILEGINDITGCAASDTAKIEFDKSIETALVEIQIMPNPTLDFVTITLTKPVQNIRLIDVFGELISVNGSSTFNTDNNGMLTLDLTNLGTGYYYLLIPAIGNFLLLKI